MMHSSDAPGDQCVTPPLPDRAEGSYNFGSRKKRLSTSVMANRLSVLALGEQLRTILHSEGTMIKDRKYHLRTYKACVVGQEMVDWLLERGEVERREEGVEVMQKLLENGVIHHGVCWYMTMGRCELCLCTLCTGLYMCCVVVCRCVRVHSGCVCEW